MNSLIKIKKGVRNIENSKAPFIYFILAFLFVITLRNFLELYPIYFEITVGALAHFYLFYICIVMALIILFHYATKERVEKVSRMVLLFSLILILPPILDLIISFGERFTITYISPEQNSDLLLNFLTFFGSFDGIGISPGMRVEIGLIILGSFIYSFIKKKSVLRSLFFSFLTYFLIFINLSVPFVVAEFFKLFGITFFFTNASISAFYLLLILFLSAWLFYLYNKKYFTELLKDIRPLRLIHFELMFILGVILVKVFNPSSTQLTQDALNWVFIMMAILFAWLFSVITNNLIDYDIDKVVNKKRPLISMAIPVEHYKKLSLLFFILAVIYSLTVSFISLFLILLFIGNYFLYSMPPFRLKRVPFFSKLLISLNSLVLVILGYFFITGDLIIPGVVITFFLTCFTAVINFIDLKDYEGDKKAGIRTLPTIFGLKKSKMIIGLFFLISYLLVYFLLKDYSHSMLENILLSVSLIILGIVQFFLINRKNYNEKPVFMVYLSGVIALIIYLAVFVKA